jgi:hypothetical protein
VTQIAASVLAVWRVTHLLHAEDGPFDVVVAARQRAGTSSWGDLLDCFSCSSLWIALPFAMLTGSSARERVLLWPALSAGAILIDRLVERLSVAEFFEEPLYETPPADHEGTHLQRT